MARLHPQLEPGLALLPSDRPLHLLTRHSVRELAKNGFADYRLPLTPEGIRLAREWGQRLPLRLASLHSSPVGRCMDTARALAEGAGKAGLHQGEVQVEQVMALVEPGCYVEDIGRIGPLFLKLGAIGFLNRHLRDNLEGLLTPSQGRSKLLGYMRERQPPAGQLAVHVTHDTILMAFVADLLGLDQVDDGHWPWMMEGAWLWFEDASVHWVWRGKHYVHEPV